jgi:hypothetical protein
MFQRVLIPDEDLKIADKYYIDDPVRAIRWLSYSNSSNHLWQVGNYYYRIGNTGKDYSRWYAAAIKAYGDAAELDPMMIPRQLGHFSTWPQTDWAIKAYIRLLESPHELIEREKKTPYREWANAARSRLGNNNSDSPDLLVHYAIKVLAEMGERAWGALPSLRKMNDKVGQGIFSFPEQWLRSWIMDAKGSIEDGIKWQNGKLDSPECSVRVDAIDYLHRMGNISCEHLEKIKSLFKDKLEYVRSIAYRAIADIPLEECEPKDIAAVVSELMTAVRKDASYHGRGAAAKALGRIGRNPVEVVAVLVDSFLSTDPKNVKARTAFVEALGMFGPAARIAIPLIEKYEGQPVDSGRSDNTAILAKACALLCIREDVPTEEDIYWRIAQNGLRSDCGEFRRMVLENILGFRLPKEQVVPLLREVRWMDDFLSLRVLASRLLKEISQ